MNVFQLIFKELSYRIFNSLLSLLAVIVAVSLCVAFFTTGKASQRETTRLMRDIGYNIRIIPKETRMDDYWAKGYSEYTIPQQYAVEFASHKDLSFNHILATLKYPIEWQGKDVILQGISSELAPPGKEKPSMIFEIEPGTVYIGYTLAKQLGINKGDTIELKGQPFNVVHTLNETGTEEDIWIFCHLSDAQSLLNKPGLINEIRALDCKCRIPGADPLEILRSELDKYFPQARMFQMSAMAEARHKQRDVVDQYFALIMPMIIIVCGVWIGALAMQNTRDRKMEIGVLRALGYKSGSIAALFLGKAVLIGLIGAAIGFFAGTALSLTYGPEIFSTTAKSIKPLYDILGWSLILAPAFAALSSFIPTMIAVTEDPAEILRGE